MAIGARQAVGRPHNWRSALVRLNVNRPVAVPSRVTVRPLRSLRCTSEHLAPFGPAATMPPMELRQVVRYAGPDRDTVRARVRTDMGLAASAGFQPMRWARWDRRRTRPCLIVEYRWSPPPTVERRRFSGELSVSVTIGDDAAAMAHCGYVQEEQRFFRAAGPTGDLVLRYRYDPATAGPPMGPLPTPLGDPRGLWWVLWPDDLGPPELGAIDTLKHAVRAAATRAASLAHRPRPA